MYDNFDRILDGAKKVGPVRVAVAGADRTTLLVMAKAKKAGIVEPVIVENSSRIKRAARKADVSLDHFKVIGASSPRSACAKAAKLVNKGEAAILMKGHVPSPDFFRAAIKSDSGLRGKNQLSHCFLFTTMRSPRIKIMTDGALNLKPDVNAKAVMIENAVALLLKLGYEQPKVAILSGTEEIRDDVQASLDAAELVRHHKKGLFKNAFVDGPIALDVAVDSESARKKKLDSSPVAGKADILITPDLLTCNIAAKCIYHFAHARYAGIVVGATAPIVSLSRADTESAKLDTLALGVLVSCL